MQTEYTTHLAGVKPVVSTKHGVINDMLLMKHVAFHNHCGQLWWIPSHNGRNGISYHQPHHYLLDHLFRCRSKKTSKLCITHLCAGNSPVTTQMASNMENVFIWWSHQSWATYRVPHHAHLSLFAQVVTMFTNQQEALVTGSPPEFPKEPHITTLLILYRFGSFKHYALIFFLKN